MKDASKSTTTLGGLSRRVFLAAASTAAGAAIVAPFVRRPTRHEIAGAIVGGNSTLGHALRDGKFPAPSETGEADIVIVGGGIGGLAAARRLRQTGFTDVVLLELEENPGGNAACGRNAVSAYPWGAHYVPIAGSDMPEVTQLFEELGIIRDRDRDGLPVYDEEMLCADPMERLFIHGRWQEGFVPQLGVSSGDGATIEKFLAEMRRLQSLRGNDGHRAFTIPLDRSSRDPEFTRLDGLTMAAWLAEKSWHRCAPLCWYVDYCCRDDYGAGIDRISAWAGVHYFASRDGRAANAPGYAVLTWPEGNGWLVQRLRSGLDHQIRGHSAVWNVEPQGEKFLVDYYDAARAKSIRLRASGVIWAAPHFIARRVIRPLREEVAEGTTSTYSPWMVANLTLDALPAGIGMNLSWDNVIYNSESLGYVVATHQNLHPVPRETVITYYLPLDAEEPAIARQKALGRSHREWCDLIIADLSAAHPGISAQVQRLDVWLWGHAMIRPVPGFIWGADRARMNRTVGNLAFANSDLSGTSIFEEAYVRGVGAADVVRRGIERQPAPA